jgi:hypothetical protein
MFLEKLYTYCIYLERSAKVAGTENTPNDPRKRLQEIPMESGRTGFKIGWQGFPESKMCNTKRVFLSSDGLQNRVARVPEET